MITRSNHFLKCPIQFLDKSFPCFRISFMLHLSSLRLLLNTSWLQILFDNRIIAWHRITWSVRESLMVREFYPLRYSLLLFLILMQSLAILLFNCIYSILCIFIFFILQKVYLKVWSYLNRFSIEWLACPTKLHIIRKTSYIIKHCLSSFKESVTSIIFVFSSQISNTTACTSRASSIPLADWFHYCTRHWRVWSTIFR